MEWSFISKSLQLFNFGDNINNILKLLQKNSTSKIEQNGYFSPPLTLERGCRQGDPIFPYLFVPSAEILAKVIRECDDTTLFLMERCSDTQKGTGHFPMVHGGVWFSNECGEN